MENIKIVYIDDSIDPILSEILASEYGDKYMQVEYDSSIGYQNLLNDKTVKSANIVIIDYKLFEDKTVDDKKITGEEFKILFNRFMPFIKVFVITQNDEYVTPSLSVRPKFRSRRGDDIEEKNTYRNEMVSLINNAIIEVKQNKEIADKLNRTSKFEKATVEKIFNSINGIDDYAEFGKEDVDYLISLFEMLKEKIK